MAASEVGDGVGDGASAGCGELAVLRVLVPLVPLPLLQVAELAFWLKKCGRFQTHVL